jgi:hypothetical protein
MTPDKNFRMDRAHKNLSCFRQRLERIVKAHHFKGMFIQAQLSEEAAKTRIIEIE